MNLYRSFGCLLESWVAEGCPDDSSETQLDPNGSDSTSSDSVRLVGVPLRSESKDSGVELPTVLSPPESLRSVRASNGSITFTHAEADEGGEDIPPSSSSPTPSSSSSLSSSSLMGAAHTIREATGSKMEQAKLEERSLMGRIYPFTTDEPEAAHRNRCNTVSTTSNLYHYGVCRKSQSLGSRRSRFHRNATNSPVQYNGNSGQTEVCCHGDHDWSGFSPGLLYLEQMCRLLEEIARLQRQNQSLQGEMENLRSQKVETHVDAPSVQKAERSEISSTQNKKTQLRGNEDQNPDEFRRRTVSDTLAFLRHRRKGKVSQSEHFASTDVLVEEPDSVQQLEDTKQRKMNNSLKEKISLLRRSEKLRHSGSSSLQNEKKTGIRHLFRKRRNTTRL